MYLKAEDNHIIPKCCTRSAKVLRGRTSVTFISCAFEQQSLLAPTAATLILSHQLKSPVSGRHRSRVSSSI